MINKNSIYRLNFIAAIEKLLGANQTRLFKVIFVNSNKIFQTFFLIFTFFAASAGTLLAQTNINPEVFWSKKSDQQNSELFKSLTGSNRLTLFAQLQQLIRVVEIANNETPAGLAIGTHTTSREEIVYLLGEPDNKIVMSMYKYNLKGSASMCKVIIGFDAAGKVNFYTVKDCN
ncbi:MAG: hypothetical protein H7296_14775 [Bacteroidia bacterium]|nr:hypothetical protein [Bacteroidia bacterium]